MRKEELCEVLADINEEYVKEARTRTITKRMVWMKYGAMVACFALIVTVAYWAIPKNLGQNGGVSTEPNYTDEDTLGTGDGNDGTIDGIEGDLPTGNGIYYEAISEKEVSAVYNAMAFNNGYLLNYAGNMYTGSYSWYAVEKSELNLDAVVETEIGPVSGNHEVFWATDWEKLHQVTTEGTLYRVKGYDEAFRVAIYYESQLSYYEDGIEVEATHYRLAIYDRLNDITMTYGRELFEERFHLEQSVGVTATLRGNEGNCELSMEDEDIQALLQAINSVRLLDPYEEGYPELEINKACTLSFCDSLGIVTKLKIYENGYVSLDGQGADGKMTVKVDAQLCQNIFNKEYVMPPEDYSVPAWEETQAIIYQGTKYCGYKMTWELEELPDDFTDIGEIAGPLTEAEEELTSTMLFDSGVRVYHYVDELGYDNFCVKYDKPNTYMGIRQAKVYTEDTELAEPEEIEEGCKLEGIIFEGNKYCGMYAKWKLEELPEDFTAIGECAGALTEAEEELTSTLVFKSGKTIYHYTDEKGYHYFCVEGREANTYFGICYAKIYDEDIELAEPTEISNFIPIREML